MEVILKQDVTHLGDKDDIVKVRNGYALNYLIPQGLAIQASDSAKKVLAENQRQAAHKIAKIKQEAMDVADKLKALDIKIPMLVGQDGKIFGSVTSLQIANQLKEKGFDLDRKRIAIAEDIKTLGSFVALINLHKEVKVEVPFEVIAKED